MKQLTVYDLMGEDMTIECKLIDTKRVHVDIIDENDNSVYSEDSHIYAWESLVSFAKQVLACDERLRQEIEVNE
jgi:hypothetical protein